MQLSRAQNTAHLPTVLLWVEQVWTKHQYRITTRTHNYDVDIESFITNKVLIRLPHPKVCTTILQQIN